MFRCSVQQCTKVSLCHLMSHTGSHLSIAYYLFNLISIQLSVDGRRLFKYSRVEMSLGLWGRFLILTTGALVVIFAVLVVACFVGPGCWGFEFLERKEKRKKGQRGEKIRSGSSSDSHCKLGRYYWLDNNDYVIYETGSRGLEAKLPKLEEATDYLSKERVFNLKCAPLLVAPNLYSVVRDSAPKLEVKLQYSEIGEEGLQCRLSIQIATATSLPCREYISTLDPFVTLEILNNKWSLQKNDRVVHAVQTKVVKNATNPTFDQTFVFDFKKIDIKNLCLKLTILDNDRLTKVNSLFERRLHLRDVKTLTTGDQVSFNLDMQEVTASTGTLLFGISYLPTAQRLNIRVIKAAKLKYRTCVQSLVDFCPYVRVVMVNNHGKCIKKKKTCFRQGDENPVFNQSLVFDLSISNLEQTVFLILLCTRTLQASTSDDSSLDGDIEASLKEDRDKVLGAIVLGRNVRCTRARDHWVTVMQNPRKNISVWHDLR